ncbi:hypothetical protein H2204_001393 [Knufia peltigerae]|uniref:Uncharacterized protein n=1 Tax=Knufia peltigerae TaxID=1002370 RepID=A0AA38YDN4_9EURO|nr:hypothetical protein H2204_001393 [Knufia peltigerae]
MHVRLAMAFIQSRAIATTKQCMQSGLATSAQLVFQQMNTTTKGIERYVASRRLDASALLRIKLTVQYQITELVVAYRQASGEDPTGLANEIERLRLENAPEHPYIQQFDELAWEHGEEETTEEDNVRANEGDEEERRNWTDPDLDILSETVASTSTTGDNDGNQQRKQSKSEIRAAKKAVKAERSRAKAAKNQRRQSVPVRSEDIEAVARVLHGEHAAEAAATHPLATDKTVEDVINRNRSFVASIEAHKKLLLYSVARNRKIGRQRQKPSGNGVRHKRSDSEQSEEKDAEMNDLVTAVLTNLGIVPAHISHGGAGSGSKKEKENKGAIDAGAPVSAIIVNLKKEIKEDLKTFEHEQREVCIRAGGFWRYVGSRVFERMTKIAQKVDWKTGRKLKE